MENSFTKQKKKFIKGLNDFIIKHKNEMDPVFTNNWKGDVEILYISHKYVFKLPGLIKEKAHDFIEFISEEMLKKISKIFDSIYSK